MIPKIAANRSSFRPFLLVFGVLFFLMNGQLQGQIQFTEGSVFNYLKGKDAAALPGNWMFPEYNVSAWTKAPAPFWYGDGTGGTQLGDMQNTYSTLYLKGTFTASNASMLKKISAAVNFDDGFTLWINGIEALSINSPETKNAQSLAPNNHESGNWETYALPTADLLLNEGTNTLAVQVFNTSLSSSDLHFNLRLNAAPELPETPDTLGLTFSHTSGFYEETFLLRITHPNANLSIVYTLDGSNPQDSQTSFKGGNMVSIPVNPLSTNGRSRTPGFIVRASVQESGFKPAKPVSRSFIFLEQVKTQTSPGGSWPSSNINGQVIDNDMDPTIVNSPTYKNLIDQSLTDIPTLSLVTDVRHLFDPATGIYVNALNHGAGWERECSIELFEHGKAPAFQVNAGMRIRGGWSRHSNFRKHAFRLFFREEYGDSKLHYPLFDEEGAPEFDKIDLRCAQNYAWQNADGKHNTFVREVVMRDAQKDAGQPYTRSRYYHLYLNGMYWGLYQTQERAEARFAADYFGGSKTDYDVIKVNGTDYELNVEATDGNLDGWMRIWNATLQGFSHNAPYFALQGKKPNGETDPLGEQLVDMENLMDYMLNIFYSGNFDAPVSAFRQNYYPNNFYGINDRTDKTRGFRFFVHDAEHSLAYEAVGPSIGLHENRVNIADIRNNPMVVTESRYFHPQWLHYKLCENAEYRQQFADRAYQQLSGNGIFTPPALTGRLNKRVAQIEHAVIAESARYGDALKEPPYTKTDWLAEINVLRNQYFPQRTSIVIQQLKNEDLYSTLEPPSVVYQQNPVHQQLVYVDAATFAFTLETPPTGTLYYTTNQTDPRAIGGGVHPLAKTSGSALQFSFTSSVQLMARAYHNGKWSALKKVAFIQTNQNFGHLKVTELHYHPMDEIGGEDTLSGKKYEFIEFKNTSHTQSIALGGLRMDSAIRYQFPEGYILEPQQFYVVAAKPNSFFEKYGMHASGNFSGNLSNGGEQIVVHDANGVPVLDFTYSDKDPWPKEPDGQGPSLVSVAVNPTGDPNSHLYWLPSYAHYGSPFKDDTVSILLSPLAPSIVQRLPVVQAYPNPTSNLLTVQVNDASERCTLTLTDLNGKTWWEEQFTASTTLSFRNSPLPPGIYIMQLENRQRTFHQKIMYRP